MALTRYQKFAKTALDLAAASKYEVAHQLCALVVNKNYVLGIGYNQPKTHPMSAGTPRDHLHAEMHALLRCESSNGADMIVVRSKPSGKPGLAKPCEVCERILRQFGIRRVFYTVNCETPDDIQLEEMKL
tara:strand:+ start:166366 stop:166755 length:390 start_codon:yes stop_codon:yes gene_type:complete